MSGGGIAQFNPGSPGAANKASKAPRVNPALVFGHCLKGGCPNARWEGWSWVGAGLRGAAAGQALAGINPLISLKRHPCGKLNLLSLKGRKPDWGLHLRDVKFLTHTIENQLMERYGPSLISF
jgi:hypothetical protein